MKRKQKDWKVIYYHCDGHNDPKPIGKEVFRFADKHEAINKFAESYKMFDKKSYRETHSIAALKFSYRENGKDILTYLLLHFQNRQFIELTVQEFNNALTYVSSKNILIK